MTDRFYMSGPYDYATALVQEDLPDGAIAINEIHQEVAFKFEGDWYYLEDEIEQEQSIRKLILKNIEIKMPLDTLAVEYERGGDGEAPITIKQIIGREKKKVSDPSVYLENEAFGEF